MQAIDMHIHVPREPGLPEIEIEAELLRYFRAPPPPTDPAEMADKFRDLDLFGVIFPWIPPPTPARNPTATTG